MRTSNSLLVMCLLLNYTVTAQPTSRANYREVKINNPRLVAKLRPFLQEQKGEVYICTSRLKYDQIEYTLLPVGNLSEFKQRSTSLYMNVENSLIFVVTGLEPMADNEQFFKKVIRPLVKGRVVDDVFSNGRINKDAVPSTYDARGLIITMGRETIEVRWVDN